MELLVDPPKKKVVGITNVVHPSIHDVNLLSEARAEGLELNFEQFGLDLYLDGLIEKPWGRECRIYADLFYDVWKLDILPGQSTSMHCHPRKETVLLCLEGTAKFHSLAETRVLEALDFVHIRKGAFHSTENIGDSVLKLVEIETPRNKFDLVRAKDKYGRQGRLYETQTLDHKIGDINQIDFLGDAKIRPTGISNKYRFGVKGGMDIICRPDRNLIFAVSLGIKNVFTHDIQVFQAGTMSMSMLEPDNLYFTIAHNL